MREITYPEAIREALREEMSRDKTVFLMGEDVGYFGGAYGVTKGILDEFGEDRVRDTPISESAIVGMAVGAAAAGSRPIAEIMFADLLCLCMDPIVNQAAKMRYMFGAKATIPLVIRCPLGGGRSAAAQHSQNLESWFIHVPGLKVAVPSTPYDVKGLLKTAIRDDNPVLFFEHQLLYRVSGPVPDEEYCIPFGQADVKRSGSDVTVVAWSLMVGRALAAAEKLAEEGISVEVVDPRTLAPLDVETIVESVKKTRRLVVVHQACKTGGVGAEIAATIMEQAFDYLDAPVVRVAAHDVPVPFSPVMENYVIPDETRIADAIRRLVS